MQLSALDVAAAEAELFLGRVKSLRSQQGRKPKFDRYEAGADTAAIKRASMDLTRALAVLRKGC